MKNKQKIPVSILADREALSPEPHLTLIYYQMCVNQCIRKVYVKIKNHI